MGETQRIVVFQQNGSGERKIAGVRRFGSSAIELEVISLDHDLPDIIDDSSAFLPEKLDADLVLDFLKHQDLSQDLAELCARHNIPVIASGKKIASKWASKPPT